MSVFKTGIGTIKISKREDGKWVGSAANAGEVVADSERGAILAINEKIKEVVESDERKAPFRIID